MDKTTAAIIVDYDFYMSSEKARDFVEKRGEYASVILFVDRPEESSDYHTLYDWNVVIENKGGYTKQVFVSTALKTLSKISNIYPVLALDDPNCNEIYLTAGVLLVISD